MMDAAEYVSGPQMIARPQDAVPDTTEWWAAQPARIAERLGL